MREATQAPCLRGESVSHVTDDVRSCCLCYAPLERKFWESLFETCGAHARMGTDRGAARLEVFLFCWFESSFF